MANVVTKICNVITILFSIVVFAVIAALIVPRFAGYETFAVLSGSMEPYYHVGSVVYVNKNVGPEEIQVGDPITFKKGAGSLATHRVIEIDSEKREFTTKGDANTAVDFAPVSFDEMVGKAGLTIPYLGYITMNIKTKQGILAAVGVLLVLIIINLIPEILKPEAADDKEKKDKGKQASGQ